MLWSVLGGVFFLALGVFLFFWPEVLWHLTEEWKSYSASEPSDLYLRSTKFGGVLFALLGAAMVLLPLIIK